MNKLALVVGVLFISCVAFGQTKEAKKEMINSVKKKEKVVVTNNKSELKSKKLSTDKKAHYIPVSTRTKKATVVKKSEATKSGK